LRHAAPYAATSSDLATLLSRMVASAGSGLPADFRHATFA
jgi:hypothetical protein